MNEEEFVSRLMEAGWPEEEARLHWDEIQNDEESGL